MTTNVLTIKPHSQPNWSRWVQRILLGASIAIVATILLTIISVLFVSSQVGLGGAVSEKMIARDGITNSSLLVGRTGTNVTLSVVGFAPIVSTLPVTAMGVGGGITTATLNGRVTDMKGMPSAAGYFEWGYAANALSNTTTTVPVTGTGDYAITITGFNQNNPIYYRFVTDADGTSYGTTSQVVIPSGVGGYLLKNLIRVLVAACILIGVLKLGGGSPVRMLVLVVIGLLAFAIVSSLIDTML